MFYTHHFARPETLSRAHTWLAHLGYQPLQAENCVEGSYRLVLAVDPPRLAEVAMLIHAVERSDPEGWPSFWEIARQDHHLADRPAPAVLTEEKRPRQSVIGWHPVD